MYKEFIDMHRQVTEYITFASVFNLAIIMSIIVWFIKFQYRLIKYKELIITELMFTKDMRRNFLLVIREISSFIRSIINSTLILLGFFSEKTFEVNVVKLYVVCLSLCIIKKAIDIIMPKEKG